MYLMMLEQCTGHAQGTRLSAPLIWYPRYKTTWRCWSKWTEVSKAKFCTVPTKNCTLCTILRPSFGPEFSCQFLLPLFRFCEAFSVTQLTEFPVPQAASINWTVWLDHTVRSDREKERKINREKERERERGSTLCSVGVSSKTFIILVLFAYRIIL